MADAVPKTGRDKAGGSNEPQPQGAVAELATFLVQHSSLLLMPKIMTASSDPVVAVKKAAAKPPFIIQFFVVQGINFRCLACCGQQGTWHDAINQEELCGDIRIFE